MHQGQEAVGHLMQTDIRRTAFSGLTRVLSHLIVGRAYSFASVFSYGRISRISSEFRPQIRLQQARLGKVEYVVFVEFFGQYTLPGSCHVFYI